MTAFSSADLPTSITPVEQLAVWSASILAEVNPTLTATAILSLALSIQSNPLALSLSKCVHPIPYGKAMPTTGF